METLYEEIDLDKNLEIDFDEFLIAVKRSEKKTYNHQLRQFFEICKNLDFEKDSLNFNNRILGKQRKLVMDAFMAKDEEQRLLGRVVLKNVSKIIKE